MSLSIRLGPQTLTTQTCLPFLCSRDLDPTHTGMGPLSPSVVIAAEPLAALEALERLAGTAGGATVIRKRKLVQSIRWER